MTSESNRDSAAIEALDELLRVIDRLRSPGGCPWDREQTEASMAPHLLEEAYEALDAVQGGDAAAACEELGDVLMNTLMIARIAAESGRFDTAAVARSIAQKLVRRHPHVFGDAVANDAAAVLANWEQIKRGEKKGAAQIPATVLGGVPAALPALLRAHRIGEKAARVGFDWPDATGPRAKIHEELAELDDARRRGDQPAVAAEVGDLLLAVASYARHLGVNPEMALRDTLARFTARFGYVEQSLGEELGKAPLARLEELWGEAKRRGIGDAR